MASNEAIELLRSIDATLKQLVTQFRAVQPKPVATDRELDSKYGDPELKFMPRDWTGPSFKGRHFSECPAPLLDLVAETFDYFATQAEQKNELYKGKPVAPYKRLDAARARGWAKRVRDGNHAASRTEHGTNGSIGSSEWGGDDDGFGAEGGF